MVSITTLELEQTPHFDRLYFPPSRNIVEEFETVGTEEHLRSNIKVLEKIHTETIARLNSNNKKTPLPPILLTERFIFSELLTPIGRMFGTLYETIAIGGHSSTEDIIVTKNGTKQVKVYLVVIANKDNSYKIGDKIRLYPNEDGSIQPKIANGSRHIKPKPKLLIAIAYGIGPLEAGLNYLKLFPEAHFPYWQSSFSIDCPKRKGGTYSAAVVTAFHSPPGLNIKKAMDLVDKRAANLGIIGDLCLEEDLSDYLDSNLAIDRKIKHHYCESGYLIENSQPVPIADKIERYSSHLKRVLT